MILESKLENGSKKKEQHLFEYTITFCILHALLQVFTSVCCFKKEKKVHFKKAPTLHDYYYLLYNTATIIIMIHDQKNAFYTNITHNYYYYTHQRQQTHSAVVVKMQI